MINFQSIFNYLIFNPENSGLNCHTKKRNEIRLAPAGFTLVELLVSIGIIFILSSVFLANYHAYGQKSAVDTAAMKLVSDIRRVQNYSLSLKKYNNITPPGGWGIRFFKSAGEYYIFANDNVTDGKYQSSELVERVTLPSGVVISAINNGGDTSRDYAYAIYIPPDPQVWLTGAESESGGGLQIPDSNYIIITLTKSSANYSRTVSVNKFGLVESN